MKENFKVYFEKNEDVLTIRPNARLDSDTGPILDRELKERLDGVSVIVVDFSQVDYISSAGLRVLLSAQKNLEKRNGSMIVTHVREDVREILDMTGFLDMVELE